MTRAIGTYMSTGVRYALTRIRSASEPRVYFPRDANCPVVTYLRVRHFNDQFSCTGHLVNIAENACLVASDKFPWRDDPLHDGRVEHYWFPRIADEVLVAIPWAHSQFPGIIKKQGNYTLRIDFMDLVPRGLVEHIASLEPQAPEDDKAR